MKIQKNTMSKEIIYEDDTIIVYEEYDPAQHIYDNEEIIGSARIIGDKTIFLYVK